MHRIAIEREAGWAIVTARGELDAYSAPELEDAFAEATSEGADRVIVDLSLTSFMDSTALGLIVRIVNEIGGRGDEARIVLPQTNARRIFEITTLDRVLPVAETRAEALAGDRGGQVSRDASADPA